MTDDERLIHLLRSAVAPVAADAPSRDLWPLLAVRDRAYAGWHWADIVLAAAAGAALAMFPRSLLLLAYHL